ncbi:AFR009Wp [Eremothecium gossypii ATCC 10895]|uniref:AFR009Wp n=1 Tax=Eremothecium gossypii (strain ATCC 10895 / CBS 109.51 / FGSC 9923 / NRRL Y-1056) TaxID=284811 RepID=Q754R3_EREGS|nr:AFR009Wp [Eremothecium gossypii ATCC 10895]AAS53380.1 AFR009Wp [Eremothecium gossypii ATCC 10895]AEY97691.1 FAFR009Wp [Eremothecium gossypii FDAG1]
MSDKNITSMQLVSPLNFSCVQPKLYRGSYPRPINLPFLRTLQLEYIVSLTPEPITNDPILKNFCEAQGIEVFHIPCNIDKVSKGKPKIKRKKKQVPIEYDVVVKCAQFLINKNHYPCYIHCSNGQLVTSLVIACLRKLSYWSTVSIFNEYLTYMSSINIHEREFIESFNSEIEISGLDMTEKVPWILASNMKSNSENDLLPSLRFHSI